MAPEHVALFREWMTAHCGGQTIPTLPREPWPALLARLQPPALVRAVWVLMAEHMATGAPVTLPPEVADVYLSDSNAWPANPCAGCHYLLPTRSTIRPDGRYHHIAVYEGTCPVCGLGTQAQEDHDDGMGI